MYKVLFLVLMSLFLFSCNESIMDNSDLSRKKSDIDSSNLILDSAIINSKYKVDISEYTKNKSDEYILYEGELPEGLILNSTTGIISGEAKETGKFEFEIAIKNSDSDNLTIIPFDLNVSKLVSLYKNIESFIDISKTSNSTLHEINDGKHISFSKAIFSFYGHLVSILTVCKEGYIKIGDSTCNPTTDINGTEDIIAPFADSSLALTTNSKIFYQVRGNTPRRMLIIQYKNLERNDDPDSEYNFEVIIHEDSSNIQFLYDISHPGSAATSNDRAYLGSHAFIGVTTSTKKYKVLENSPKIFRGTVITLHAPINTLGNYNTSTKWLNNNYITSNIVTNYVDIARYNKNAQQCTANSDCTISNICIDGYSGKRCAKKDLTDLLLYNFNLPLRLPFNFKFYGSNFTDFYVTENGYIYFGSKNTSNIVFPTKSTAVHISSIPVDYSILPMFSNIDLKSAMGGHVTYNVIGTSPKRRAIIMYDNVRIIDNGNIHNCSYEIVLHEKSNIIEFLYGSNNESDVCLGRMSTVGLRKNSSDFIEISANNRALGQGKSVTFIPDNANVTSYSWVGVGNDKKDFLHPNSNDSSIRSIYLDETNSSFMDLPLRDVEINPVPLVFGEDIEELYLDGNLQKTYKVYDLNNATASGYNFKFKGKTYDKLFIDGHGAVSFGNDDTAEMVIAPMWGNVYHQSELESLETPYEDVENDFMWIANSGNDTLSKINTHTGVKIGDYPVGDNPSRTAVAFDGSVWVGNRNSDDVWKLDRYGNFVCKVYLNPGCGPRGLALDKDENLWVGCYYGNPHKYIYKITDTKVTPSKDNNYAPRCKALDIREPNDNSSNMAFKGNSYGTYGFAFDKHGILWSSKLGYSDIIRINTNKAPGTSGFYEHFPMSVRTYGLVVDYDDNIWHARYDGGASNIGILKSTYNKTTHTLSTQTFPIKDGSYGNGRGVAIDRQGNIWVAYSNLSKVGKYAPDGTALGLFPLNGNLKSNSTVGSNCTNPIGIGVDGDGDVWANCYSTGNSEELDSNTGIELHNFATGPSPYCYSDNTGFSLRNITSNLIKTQFHAKTVKYKVYDPSNKTKCLRIERKLVVQWNNVRMKKVDVNNNPMGYTESTFEIIFDNGRSFVSNPGIPNAEHCDESNLQEDSTNRDVTITYVYGSIKGSDYDLKTGGNSETTLRAIYAIDSNNLQYEHVIGSHDAGTINSGSKFVISSSK